MGAPCAVSVSDLALCFGLSALWWRAEGPVKGFWKE